MTEEAKKQPDGSYTWKTDRLSEDILTMKNDEFLKVLAGLTPLPSPRQVDLPTKADLIAYYDPQVELFKFMVGNEFHNEPGVICNLVLIEGQWDEAVRDLHPRDASAPPMTWFFGTDQSGVDHTTRDGIVSLLNREPTGFGCGGIAAEGGGFLAAYGTTNDGPSNNKLGTLNIAQSPQGEWMLWFEE